jgi:hypothetical protein
MPLARHVVERQMPPLQLPEQHWLPRLHVAPRPTQVEREQRPTRQLSPAQHSLAVPHASPDMRHEPALRHRLDRHRPAQQSVVAAHVAFSPRQKEARHTPPEHTAEQHISLVEHATPVPAQVGGAAHCPDWHVSPLQHSLGDAHRPQNYGSRTGRGLDGLVDHSSDA